MVIRTVVVIVQAVVEGGECEYKLKKYSVPNEVPHHCSRYCGC